MRVLSVFLATILAATGAQAQMSLLDGSISFAWGMDDEGPVNQRNKEFAADLTFGITPAIDVEVNLGLLGIDDDGGFGNGPSYASIHGIYNFGSAGRAGLLYEEVWSHSNYGYKIYSAEYQYRWNDLLLEVQGGMIDSYFSNVIYDSNNFLNLGVAYDFGSINLGVDHFTIFWPGSTYAYMTTLHAGYDIGNSGFELFAEANREYYSDSPNEINTWLIGAKYNFGAGSRDAFGSVAHEYIKRITSP